MKKWITAVAVLALGTGLAVAQEGHEHRRGPSGPPPSFVTTFGDKLALTDAQKDQIQKIEAKTREDNAAFFESSRKLMDEMRAAREANDTAKMESLRPAMKANREQMMKIHEAELARILPALTADQRAQYDKIQAERDAHRRDRSQG